MADLKISQLNSIVTVVPATDVLPVVQGGTTLKITPNQILGSGGTATLASATITGALTVDTTTLKVDATNHRVGIGTASPAVAFHVLGAASATVEIAKIGASSGPYVGIGTEGTNYSWIQAFGGAPLRINPQGNNTILNQSSGTVLAGLSTANASGGILQLSSGITFPATQVAASDANTLDDYEEGTWQGTLTGGTTNPTAPVTVTGKYTKIGRQVSVTIYFNNVSTVGASGAVRITGLPFTEDGSRANGTAACYGFDFNSGTSVFVNVDGTTLGFTSMLTNSNWRDVLHNAGVLKFLQANVIYYV
jgi:hypothetical protein